jgi:hypothetical protein
MTFTAWRTKIQRLKSDGVRIHLGAAREFSVCQGHDKDFPYYDAE